jgi:hypothetical protein
MSAISRYLADSIDRPMSLEGYPSMKLVHSWKITVNSHKSRDIAVHHCFQSFCRSFTTRSSTVPPSIEVLVIPQGAMYNSTTDDYLDISTVLEPLRLLRNLATFKLRDADIDEIAPNFRESYLGGTEIISCLPEYGSLQQQLTELVTGNSPVKLIHEMYAALHQYSQSFERNLQFKNEIDQQGNCYDYDEDYDYYVNPFKTCSPPYPIETGLQAAKIACEKDDIAAFKKHRNAVLSFLEPQYSKIEACADRAATFVKSEKKRGEFFDLAEDDRDSDPLQFRHRSTYDILLLLKDYAKSFKRTKTESLRIQLLRSDEKGNLRYHDLPRETALWTISRRAKERHRSHAGRDLLRIIEGCIDDIDTKYL